MSILALRCLAEEACSLLHLLTGRTLDVHKERLRVRAPSRQRGILPHLPLENLALVCLVTLHGTHTDAVLQRASVLCIQLVVCKHITTNLLLKVNLADHDKVAIFFLAAQRNAQKLVSLVVEEPAHLVDVLCQCLVE